MIRDTTTGEEGVQSRRAAKPRKAISCCRAELYARARAAQKATSGRWLVATRPGVVRWPDPVVAAAVVLDPNNIPKGLDDSKKRQRASARRCSKKSCATSSFAVAYASPARIDRDNILRASLWALALCGGFVAGTPRHVFVDGRDRIDYEAADCEAVIGGRRAGALHRSSFDHRQGVARPADVPRWPRDVPAMVSRFIRAMAAAAYGRAERTRARHTSSQPARAGCVRRVRVIRLAIARRV